MNTLQSTLLLVLVSANTTLAAPMATPSLPLQAVAQRADMRSISFELAFELDDTAEDGALRFSSRGPGYGLFLTSEGATLSLLKPDGSGFETLGMRLVGGATGSELSGLSQIPGYNHYYKGNDPSAWRESRERYGAVQYDAVYPGVDLVFYGTAGELEYDFIVAPGADAGQVRIAFEGATQLQLIDGDLHLSTAEGEVVQQAPVVYQEVDGARVAVDAEYVLAAEGAHEVSFLIGEYDRTQPLVIDPILSYASFYGGVSDEAFQGGVVIDSAGNMLLSGWTTSPVFPTVNPAQTTQTSHIDAMVVKLAPDGQSVIYSTYFGGSRPAGDPASSQRGRDEAWGIAVDAAGNAYVVGDTCSPDMPVTPGAYDQGCGSDGNCDGGDGFHDTFVLKLSPSGALVYSTYLGGSSYDRPLGGIAVDAAGNAYVAGWTSSQDFPTTPGAFDTTFNGMSDAFVTKLSADGSSLIYSTYLGGGVPTTFVTATDTPYAIAVDAQGNAYVGGTTGSADFPTTAGAFQENAGPYGGANGYLVKLSADGSSLVYSTYLEDVHTKVSDLLVDDQGRVWAGGQTNSQTFPTTPGAYQENTVGDSPDTDAFVVQLDASGSTILAATYLSTVDDDSLTALGVDPHGNVFALCYTESNSFPLVDPIYSSAPGNYRAAISRFSPDLSTLTFSTLLGFGATSGSMDIGPGSEVYVAGKGTNGTYGSPVSPTVNPVDSFSGGSSDAYVAVLDGFLQCNPATSYCTTSINSAGYRALMNLQGTVSLNDNSCVLVTTGLVPNQPGLYYYGPDQISLPFGNGTRCVGGTVFRLNPSQVSSALGVATRILDFTQAPLNSGPGMIVPGSTWNFQYWYRDPAGGGSNFNLSDGLSITFCP